MDLAAAVLCMENKMPMTIFGLNEENSIINTVKGFCSHPNWSENLRNINTVHHRSQHPYLIRFRTVNNIFATSAVIAGAVKGDIDVHGPVILDTSAIVMGNIKSKSVQSPYYHY